MEGIRAMLAVLELRHILAVRTIVRMLPPVHPELAAWLDHALTWEECRRRGVTSVLLSPAPVMGKRGPMAAADALRTIRGRLVESIQVRLLLAAVRTKLETDYLSDPVSSRLR